MTGAQFQEAMIGDTATERNSNEVWAEYYDASGVIRGQEGGSSYTGAWSLDGDRIFFDCEGTSYDGCWTIAVCSDRIFYFGDDGTLHRAPGQLLSGNPQDL